MKTLLVMALLTVGPWAAAKPIHNMTFLAKNKDVLVKFQPGKKATFEKIKIAGDDNEPVPPPDYMQPIRYGKLKTVIKKMVIDMTQPEPIWREEVVCTVDAAIGVYQIDENSNGMMETNETICPTTLNGVQGDLHVSGMITFIKQGSDQVPAKVFNSWFYFISTPTSNDQPPLFAGDSGAALTKQLNLKDLTFALGYGFNDCVIAQPVPSPRLSSDSGNGNSSSPICQNDDTLYAEFEMVDSQ